MLGELLVKTRQLNAILQNRGEKEVSFNELCETLADILEVDVYVIVDVDEDVDVAVVLDGDAVVNKSSAVDVAVVCDDTPAVVEVEVGNVVAVVNEGNSRKISVRLLL